MSIVWHGLYRRDGPTSRTGHSSQPQQRATHHSARCHSRRQDQPYLQHQGCENLRYAILGVLTGQGAQMRDHGWWSISALCTIHPLRSCFRGTCNCYSSIYGLEDNINMATPLSFAHTYWTENLINPVLFYDAISTAI
jgi:hypothetical protein